LQTLAVKFDLLNIPEIQDLNARDVPLKGDRKPLAGPRRSGSSPHSGVVKLDDDLVLHFTKQL